MDGQLRSGSTLLNRPFHYVTLPAFKSDLETEGLHDLSQHAKGRGRLPPAAMKPDIVKS